MSDEGNDPNNSCIIAGICNIKNINMLTITSTNLKNVYVVNHITVSQLC